MNAAAVLLTSSVSRWSSLWLCPRRHRCTWILLAEYRMWSEMGPVAFTWTLKRVEGSFLFTVERSREENCWVKPSRSDQIVQFFFFLKHLRVLSWWMSEGDPESVLQRRQHMKYCIVRLTVRPADDCGRRRWNTAREAFGLATLTFAVFVPSLFVCTSSDE